MQIEAAMPGPRIVEAVATERIIYIIAPLAHQLEWKAIVYASRLCIFSVLLTNI